MASTVSTVKPYPSRELAEAAADAYKKAWPRVAYGTDTTIYPVDPAHPEGSWNMSATRDSSCA